jgi:UDP-N-acetylmuramate--alanine ligase
VCVIEADEYDRSFLKLHPDISVISSMDPDHLDIYGTAEEMKLTFIEFASKVKEDGVLFYKQNLTDLKDALVSRKVTYSPLLEKSIEKISADIQVKNIQNTINGYRFDVQVFGEVIEGLDLKTGGIHNIENMSVAIGICKALHISSDKIKDAVSAYKGVKRRFEYIVSKASGVQFIDDYAHHPRELEALLTSVRALYPGKKVTILFQPHLFSRTRDFAEGFATSLNLADEVLLLPVYPARELPIEGVTSELLAKNIPGVKMLEMNEVHTWIANNEIEIFVTAGAGDIDTLIPGIKAIIESK